MRRKRRRKQRRQRRNRTIHQPGQSRLHHAQNKQPPRRFLLPLARRRRQMLPLQLPRQRRMFRLSRRQIPQQFPRRHIAGPLRRPLIKPPRLGLHRLGQFPHRLDPQRPHQPHGPMPNKPLHILPPNQRNMLAKTLAIQLRQHPPMLLLLGLHPLKHLRRRRIIRPQRKIDIRINPRILLLIGNRQRQNLLLRQIRKSPRHRHLLLSGRVPRS